RAASRTKMLTWSIERGVVAMASSPGGCGRFVATIVRQNDRHPRRCPISSSRSVRPFRCVKNLTPRNGSGGLARLDPGWPLVHLVPMSRPPANTSSQESRALRAVLSAVVRTAAEVCGGRDAQIVTLEGQQCRLVAQWGTLASTFRVGRLYPAT